MKYLFILLFSLPAFADFTGSFQGTGRAVFAKTGKAYECSEIFLRLKEKTDSFTFNEGGYICGDLQASFDTFIFSVKEGKLFIKDKEVGSITPGLFEYTFYDPEDNSTYHLVLFKLSETTLSYIETWHVGNTLALTVKGLLEK